MRVRIAPLVVAFALGAVASAIFAYCAVVLSKGELGEKRGYATLQGVEFAHRSDSDVQNSIVLFNPMESSYVLLGVPTHDARYPRAWIILNEPTPRGSVYVLPKDQQYYLSCSYLAELSSKTKIAPQVLQFLSSNCIS